jgi:hypothetical protein
MALLERIEVLLSGIQGPVVGCDGVVVACTECGCWTTGLIMLAWCVKPGKQGGAHDRSLSCQCRQIVMHGMYIRSWLCGMRSARHLLIGSTDATRHRNQHSVARYVYELHSYALKLPLLRYKGSSLPACLCRVPRPGMRMRLRPGCPRHDKETWTLCSTPLSGARRSSFACLCATE